MELLTITWLKNRDQLVRSKEIFNEYRKSRFIKYLLTSGLRQSASEEAVLSCVWGPGSVGESAAITQWAVELLRCQADRKFSLWGTWEGLPQGVLHLGTRCKPHEGTVGKAAHWPMPCGCHRAKVRERQMPREPGWSLELGSPSPSSCSVPLAAATDRAWYLASWPKSSI